MAEETPPPSVSVSQPSSQVPPTIDYYEKIVERAHKEIEWTQKTYTRLAGFLTVIGLAVIGSAAFLSYRTMHDQNVAMREMKKDVEKGVADAKDKAMDQMQLYINKQIAEQFALPHIQQTLENVARARASEIIEERLNQNINETKKISRKNL